MTSPYTPPPGSIPTFEVPSLAGIHRVHLIGIGGAGMSGVARLLLARGVEVRGSDLKDSRGLEDLRDAGASVFVGHRAEQLTGPDGALPDAVVMSSAVPEGNPELAEARTRGLRVLARAQVLAALAAGRRTLAVSGTHGKTTTTYLLESVFRSAGLIPGVIGTTGVRIDGEPVPFPRTTPEAPDLHRLLARMADRDVRAVAMEVSSHGLHQHRVGGVRYGCAVFTNLTQDHLDYHASMEEYFEAKARLFTPAMSDRAVVNFDSPEGRRLIRPDLPTLTFGLEEGADVRATDVRTTPDGVSFRVGELDVRSSLRGLFNVENCLATLATARSLGIADDASAKGIETIRGVPGRVETVEEGQRFLVMVDYAHTPDSVENVLRAARQLAAGRLIAVFGCGGDRDRAKRPLMGKVATGLADLTIITSDNPRSEDPAAIISDIEPGAKEGGGAYVIEPDRRAAIRLAVSQAREGDVVVIAGKGHETGQEFAGRTVPFDDRSVAAEEIRALRGPA